MSSLYANTVNEIIKIFSRKKTVVWLIVSALIPVGAALLLSFYQNKLGVFVVNSTGFPVLLLGLFSTFLLPLFIFSLAADLFSGEVGKKTLKLTMVRPITRFKIFLSKNISLGIFIIVYLGLMFIISVNSGFFLEKGIFSGNGLFKVFLAYFVTVLPMLFLSIMAGFLAQFIKSSGGALTSSVFVYLAGKAVPFFSFKLAPITPFSYTGWYFQWIGSTVNVGGLINAFLIILSYSLIFFALGFYLFDKQDI